MRKKQTSSFFREPFIKTIFVTDEAVTFDLLDGRTISAPLAWYPRLLHGTRKERKNWRLIADGKGVHWNDLDEDISVSNMLLGQPSSESLESFKMWLEKYQSSSKSRGKINAPKKVFT